MKKFMMLFNYGAFQLCWFTLLLYADHGVIAVGVYLMAHLSLIYYIDNIKNVILEICTLVLVSIIGLSADYLLTIFSVYNFPNNLSYFLLPFWYIALWPLFASTLHHCFYLFHSLHYIYLVLIGAVSLPVIYYGAQKATSNFVLGEPVLISLIYVALIWAFLLPLFIKLTLILRAYFNLDLDKAEY